MHIYRILPILAILLSTTSVQAIVNDPNRPIYPFSEKVFEDLPPYPPDLPEIRHLYATQTLQDYDRLTPEYYLQPEFYPWWFDICNKTYTKDPRIHGKFGAGFYPSKADITLQEGTEFILTTLLYTSPGVECYQGTVINLSYDKSKIYVEILEPNKTEVPTYTGNKFFLLLKPTYPKFNKEWVKKFKIRIVALSEGDTTLIVKNEKPPKVIDDYYRELYGNNYTSGNTFFGMTLPAFKASIHILPQDEGQPFVFDTLKNNNFYPYILIALIITAIIAIACYIHHRKKARYKKVL